MAEIKTKEEKLNRLAEIKNILEGMSDDFNDANRGGNIEEVSKLDAEMRKLTNEYTSIARIICFQDCSEADDPVIEAARRLSFTTLSIKDSKEEDTATDGTIIKVPVRKVEEKEKTIDLLKLHKFIEGGIGQSKDWNAMIEKFNFTLTCQTARDLGIKVKSINDSYLMSEIAAEYDLGKNPASKSNLLKTLNAITAALVGEGYKASTHDVNYLLKVYNKKDNRAKLTVSCANHNYLRAYVLDILHRIVCKDSYAVSYKVKKQ